MARPPLFLGAQPLEDLKGPYAGFAVLSHEGLRGLDLVSSLHPEQAKVAVLSSEPLLSDVLTGVGRRNSLSRFEGLPAGDLDAPQKKLLLALVEEYVRNADFDAARESTLMLFNALASISCTFRGAVRRMMFVARSAIGFTDRA